MIKAIDTAAQGMLQAEKRATDIAKNILRESAAGASSFSLEGEESSQSNPSNTAQNTNTQPTGPSPSTTQQGFGNLIQHFADLRAEEHAFKANAATFKKLDETYDKALGSLIDDES